jgi:hypothetical protein
LSTAQAAARSFAKTRPATSSSFLNQEHDPSRSSGSWRHPALSTAYDCREMLIPHLDALLDKVEAAGRDRGQAASALMYLAAKRLKPA